MDKEFVGKKRFYSINNPSINVIARIYVIETRTDQFFTAVLEDGNSYQIEKGGPIEEICCQYFVDLDNVVFTEYPTKEFNGCIRFFDKIGNFIGSGDLLLINTQGNIQYAFQLVSEKNFKYKRNGWNYEVGIGDRISGLMELSSGPFTFLFEKIFHMQDNETFGNYLTNRYYQICCKLPDYSF